MEGERTVCLPDVRVGEHLEELLVELVRERRGAAHDEADMRAQVVVLHCRVLVPLSIWDCLSVLGGGRRTLQMSTTCGGTRLFWLIVN